MILRCAYHESSQASFTCFNQHHSFTLPFMVWETPDEVLAEISNFVDYYNSKCYYETQGILII